MWTDLLHRFGLTVLLVGTLLISTHIDGASGTTTVAPTKAIHLNPEYDLYSPLHSFGARIFRAINNTKENQLISPLSIHSALCMVLLGASPDSQTEKELQDILVLDGDLKERIHENYRNLITIFKDLTQNEVKGKYWHTFGGQKETPPAIDPKMVALVKGKSAPIHKNYTSEVGMRYLANIEQVRDDDKESKQNLADSLNDWGRKSGFQDDLITVEQLSEQFSMILFSAVRVESTWFEAFDEIKAKKLFYNFGRKDSPTNNSVGLSLSAFHAHFIEFSSSTKAPNKELTDSFKKKYASHLDGLLDLDFQAIEINLHGNLNYVILMPIKTTIGNELIQLEENLLSIDPKHGNTKLNRALEALSLKEAEVTIRHFRMPAFKFENKIDLKEPFRSIGLKRIFDEQTAELSKMSPSGLFVSEANHQSVIEVNKQGLRAAAITSVRVRPKSALYSAYKIDVFVDNPFLFVLRHNKVPLFIGHVVKV